MSTGALILVAFLGLLGGASVTAFINQYARRRVTRAEAESLTVESALKLIAVQDQKIEEQNVQLDRMHSEIRDLRDELAHERIRCDEELSAVRMELATAVDVIKRAGLA